MKAWIQSFIISASLLIPAFAFSQEAAGPMVAPSAPSAPAPAPNASGVQEVQKPLEITGQSRNLSMLMVLRGEKDGINFLNVRKNYKDEVPETVY